MQIQAAFKILDAFFRLQALDSGGQPVFNKTSMSTIKKKILQLKAFSSIVPVHRDFPGNLTPKVKVSVKKYT